MSAPELKPCPFCGPQFDIEVKPVLYGRTAIADGYVTEYTVACHNCGIELHGEYESDAIAAWNTRATSEADALRAENERLRDALVVLADAATVIFTENGMTTFEAHPATPALWDATAGARIALKGTP